MEASSEPTLRERKKQRTRQAISDAAMELFAQRGFEAVTIDDVAAAAQVSKKTVFNYFDHKEDLLFDEAEAAEARLIAAVRERPPDESVLGAIRRHHLAALARMCSGDTPWIVTMSRLVDASPSLQTREVELYARFAHSLAEAIRAELGLRPTDARPYIAASAMMGVMQAVVLSARRRVLAGQQPRTLARAVRDEAERGYALLEHGFADLTVR